MYPVERGTPSRKSAKALPGVEPVELVAAELFAVKERNLILVFDVLDVDSALHRVSAADPRQRLAALHHARQDVERLHAAGRDERSIAETECRESSACRRRRQARSGRPARSDRPPEWHWCSCLSRRCSTSRRESRSAASPPSSCEMPASCRTSVRLNGSPCFVFQLPVAPRLSTFFELRRAKTFWLGETT